MFEQAMHSIVSKRWPLILMMDRTSHGRPKKTKTMMIGRSEATSEQSGAQSPIQAGSLLFHCSPLTNMVNSRIRLVKLARTLSILHTALWLADMLIPQGRMHARDGLLHARRPDGDGGRRRRRLRWWALPFPRPHPQVWLLGLKTWYMQYFWLWFAESSMLVSKSSIVRKSFSPILESSLCTQSTCFSAHFGS